MTAGRDGRPALAVLAALAVVTAGCGTGQADAPEAAPPPSLRPEPSEAPAASPEPPARPAAAPAAADAVPEPAPAATPASFAAWRAGFRRRAIAAGIEPALIDRAFAGVGVNRTVLERDRYQPEFTRPIWAYLDSAVSPTRIANGRSEYGARSGLLARIEERFGVDAETVVAVWGLESAYGAVRGDIGVIEALATLAHDGRRRDFAEEQLIAALRILQAGDTSPARMRGSWAGAMGHTQFIPTSYLAYAADITGDGRRDIWADDPSDALASTANYLARFGWERGAPAVARVTLPAGFDYRLADQSIRRPVSDWRAMGVAPAAGDALPEAAETAIVLPTGADGPAWIAYPNFRVIKRYNNATSYALAIALLGQEIAGDGAGVSGLSWPRGQSPLSRPETQGLQRALTALGYDTRGVDGIVGPDTRNAVRAFQADRGLTPDGYVTGALLEAVRAAGG